MHFQFLIEDQSGGILINHIIQKLLLMYPNNTFDCKSFRGIGGFTKKNTVKETKTGKLLNDLITYMKGFSKSLQGIDAAIIVVLDNDDNNPEKFREMLESTIRERNISIDHTVCLAVEEMEAWLLGDRDALKSAYPGLKVQILNNYVQDSICGTWETLAEAIYPGGMKRLKKDCPTFREVGALKAQWADRIGKHLDLNSNMSPSFQFLILELQRRVS